MSAAATPSNARNVTCARCGAGFDCALDKTCWCAAEPYRLPMPSSPAEDCLCPSCLRKAAAERGAPTR
jgi:hypothetical protein